MCAKVGCYFRPGWLGACLHRVWRVAVAQPIRTNSEFVRYYIASRCWMSPGMNVGA